MALGVTDLKKGTIFQIDGTPYKVVEYGQKVMGRGGSIVNVKIKSLLDGRILDKTYKGNDSIQSADVLNSNAQYLYADDKTLFFMDTKSYETIDVPKGIVGQQAAYLKEGCEVVTQSFNGHVISIDPPKNVYLKVTQAEDAVKGDTSSAITKDAVLETGAKVKVPAFIKTGDIISVDTTTGNYRERKNKLMTSLRLDQYLQKKKLVSSRSQAENYIKLGYVKLDGDIVLKPSKQVAENSVVNLTTDKTYVSRAALKLESVSAGFDIEFEGSVVLDVGSSTGGFTEYALTLGASKVIAIEAGTNQMDSKLRLNQKLNCMSELIYETLIN